MGWRPKNQFYNWVNLLICVRGYYRSEGFPERADLVPALDGSWLLPDWESSWDVAAAAVTWKFRLAFGPGNYLGSFEIGIWLIIWWEISGPWDRGSTQKFEPDWSSRVIWPGEPFCKKKTYVVSISKNEMCFVFGKHGNSMCWQTKTNVQMTISTISTYPKLESSKQIQN